jgi:beta-phosphoglucomutase-like phosphatase (HAD superfamily)
MVNQCIARDYEAALFDLDGVLVESRELWFHLMNALARDLGCPEITLAMFERSWGQSVDADAEVFYRGRSAKEIGHLYEAYFARFTQHLKIDSEARVGFETLRRCGLRIAVVTNTPKKIAREMVAAAGLHPDLILSGEEVRCPKPAGDILIASCERLKVSPERCVLAGFRIRSAGCEKCRCCLPGLRMDGDRRFETLAEVFSFTRNVMGAL